MKNQILSSTTIIILIISLVSEVFDFHTLSLITFILSFIPIILQYFTSPDSHDETDQHTECCDKIELDQMNLEELENYQMELEFDLVEIRQMIKEKKA
jgi:energy-converting hydrogenase Eha subunit H